MKAVGVICRRIKGIRNLSLFLLLKAFGIRFKKSMKLHVMQGFSQEATPDQNRNRKICKNIISKNLVLVWESSMLIFTLIKDAYEPQISEGAWMQAFGSCLISNNY